MKNLIFISFFLIRTIFVNAQFAPAAGETGTTAIAADDVSFVGWANSCTVKRGFVNKADTSYTYTQNAVTSNHAFFGTESLATGMPGGTLDCISLGDGGSAVLTFEYPIMNGDGADFAVFENGLKMQESPALYFLELAFVEVSTDGKKFVRFPAISNTQTSVQLSSFGAVEPTEINNLAGKYMTGYGTPFDLEELKDSAGINVDSINYIRIMDVVGSIDKTLGSFDSKGNLINDPFPTPFYSSGFDLESVGAIHMNGLTATPAIITKGSWKLYPNPLKEGNICYIHMDSVEEGDLVLTLINTQGQLMGNWETKVNGTITIPINNLKKGFYFLKANQGKQHQVFKIIVE